MNTTGTATLTKKGARTYSRHGLNTLRRALTTSGKRLTSRRYKLGRALWDWRQELIDALGGDMRTSPQQCTLIDLSVIATGPCSRQTFADQAVIAIENARLLSELQARTGDLTRSVNELRALGEVSQALSSTLDVDIVLNTIVARANDFIGAERGLLVGCQLDLRASAGRHPCSSPVCSGLA
jgi:hypothetical protein